MPNLKNIDKLITAIKDGEVGKDKPFKFGMANWIVPRKVTNKGARDDDYIPTEWCNTACCIGGAAWALMHPKRSPKALYQSFHGEGRYERSWGDESPTEAIADWLGISTYEAQDLFGGRYANVGLAKITKRQGIKVLKNLRNVGEVDWDYATDS